MIVIGLIIIPLITVYSQQKTLQFKHLTTDNGLSSSHVVSALLDHKGYMWLGTYNGLNRYDGTSIVVYKKIPGDSTSIPDNHIGAIFEDRGKNLLFGTWKGLARYDRNTNRFIDYKLDSSSALVGMSSVVNGITEDSTGNLWLSTNFGLRYFDRKNNKLTNYRNDPLNSNTINYNYLTCLYLNKAGQLWIATRKGIDLFVSESKTFKHVTYCKTHQNSIPDTYFQCIVEDNDSNMWFGSVDGLYCLEKKNAGKMELVHYTNNPNDRNSLSINNVKSLMVDAEGLLWIGTDNGGLNIYHKESNNFSRYRKDDFNPNSLNNETIHALTQDRTKNSWVCTFGGGVNISEKSSGFILHYKNLPGTDKSLSHNVVSCFFEDPNGRIWVGTDGGGFNRFDKETGRFTRFMPDNKHFKSNAVLSIAEGEENQIWLGTWAGGLVNYNYATNKFTTLTTLNSSIPDNSIYSMVKDKNGNLWMGSFTQGLIYFIVREKKFIQYSIENSELLNRKVNIVKMDKKGLIYVGTPDGLQIFQPEQKRFTTYTNNPNSSNSLSYNAVVDILPVSDSCVWIATENGLNRLNPLSGVFTRYFKENGLPDNTIKGLAIDYAGRLWATTSMGISLFDQKENSFKNFDKSDGLQGNEFYWACILTTKAGEILAGGTNGFNRITPEKYYKNNTLPEIIITDFKISNQRVEIGTKGSPLTKQISETKQLTLKHNQSVLTFYFAALDYTNPQKNQYAYIMENFDEDWTYCGNRKEATYTNLNPGKYIFRVKGSNNDGVWNEVGTALMLTITPPWWKTKIAIGSFILFLFCLFLGIYYYRVRQLKAQQLLLEKLVIERTHEIEEQDEKLKIANNQLTQLNATKDQFFSILAHDLRNPFNNILGFTEILNSEEFNIDKKETKAITKQLYLSASSTYNLLENLLEWSRTQSNRIPFQPQYVDFLSIYKEVVESLLVNSKNISINYESTEKIKVYADENMLKAVLRNLISNAIKYTHKNGTINIRTEKDITNVTVTVSDNGIGIQKDDLGKLFDFTQKFSSNGTAQEKGTGLGLIICKEFVEKHGGQIWAESDPGKGSNFKFTIPVKTQTK